MHNRMTRKVLEEAGLIYPDPDLVQVIRCKDCKHCNREMAVGEWEGSCRYWNTHSVMLNDFCSRAKRKEEWTNT